MIKIYSNEYKQAYFWLIVPWILRKFGEILIFDGKYDVSNVEFFIFFSKKIRFPLPYLCHRFCESGKISIFDGKYEIFNFSRNLNCHCHI